MKITLEHLSNYIIHATQWLRSDIDNQNTKLASCIERFSRKIKKYTKDLDELTQEHKAKVNDAYTDFASEDQDKNIMKLIVKDDTGKVTYTENKYTREGKKLLDAKLRELNKKFNDDYNNLMQIEVEIEPSFCSSIPNNLNDIQVEYLTGVVIEPVKLLLNGHSKSEKVKA